MFDVSNSYRDTYCEFTVEEGSKLVLNFREVYTTEFVYRFNYLSDHNGKVLTNSSMTLDPSGVKVLSLNIEFDMPNKTYYNLNYVQSYLLEANTEPSELGRFNDLITYFNEDLVNNNGFTTEELLNDILEELELIE